MDLQSEVELCAPPCFGTLGYFLAHFCVSGKVYFVNSVLIPHIFEIIGEFHHSETKAMNLMLNRLL